MKIPLLCSLLAAAPIAFAPTTFAQDPCPGTILTPGTLGLSAQPTSIGVNGDRIAFPLSGPWVSHGADGGSTVFRVLPGTFDVIREDTLVAPNIGSGFGARVLGAAVASSGAVLVARSAPVPDTASLYQLRRASSSGPVVVTSMDATATISSTEGHRRFSSDGDRAVLASWAGQAGGRYVVLDFYSVNAAGDWVHEDTVRSARVNLHYFYFDVTLRGNQATFRAQSSDGWFFNYERASNGRWREISSPPALAATPVFEGILSSNVLVTTHLEAGVGNFKVHERQPGGAWTLTTSTSVFSAAGTSARPGAPQVARTSAGVELISVNVSDPNAPNAVESRVYERTAAGLSLRATIDARIARLTGSFAVLENGVGQYKVIAMSDLVGDVRNCITRGTAACLGQRAGDLHYLLNAPFAPLQDGELLLTGAPAGSAAFMIGSTQRIPSAGALASLCVGTSGQVVRLPEVLQTEPDGTASWTIRPTALPLTSGGTLSGVGQQFVFQAVVRTNAGAATSRAVVATL